MDALPYSTFLARIAGITSVRRERIADMARAMRIANAPERDFARAMREMDD